VEFSIGNLPEGQANPGSLSVEVGRYAFGGCSCDNCAVIDADLSVLSDNGYNVMGGWRVGQAPEESTTRSGLLVPIGTKDGNDALALVDVQTGQRFWAVSTGAWRFIWPPTGKPVIAVRESQIIAEEEQEHVGDEGQYL
jgi:hypothetical protein